MGFPYSLANVLSSVGSMRRSPVSTLRRRTAAGRVSWQIPMGTDLGRKGAGGEEWGRTDGRLTLRDQSGRPATQ
jgi:hypothetical protein